jgi:ABC-type antimicrobial peptide transport system permease subunit
LAQLAPQFTSPTFVRARPGVSATALAGDFATHYADDARLATQQYGTRIDAIEGLVQNVAVHRDARRQLRIFLAGSVLLALVAAANVSLFLLARAPGRRRELSIRMAVGARSNRIARQLATEAGVLLAGAAVLGLALSAWLATFLRGLVILREAEWENVTLLDWRVLGLTGAVLIALTVLVSLAPILDIRRLGLAESSREAMARASLAQ